MQVLIAAAPPVAAKASSLRAKFEQMAAGGGEDKVSKEKFYFIRIIY